MTFQEEIINSQEGRGLRGLGPSSLKLRLSSMVELQKEVIETIPDIPEHDLMVLKKLYFKRYPDCGRKRGAILRYIRDLRKEHEVPNRSKELIKHINRASKK